MNDIETAEVPEKRQEVTAPEIHRREFEHRGVRVTEIVWQWTPEKRKMAWVRNTPDEMKVDGRPNPWFHFDYTINDASTEKDKDFWDYIARNRCRQAFEKYWRLEPRPVPPETI